MPLNITIPRAEVTTPSSGKPYTSYTLSIAGPLRTSSTSKRYSDFERLHRDVTEASGSEPPTPLPPKSWIRRTVNDPTLTEERRQGLERYARAIEGAEDARWRNSKAWRDFLGGGAVSTSFKESSSGGWGSARANGSGGIGGQITTASGWLEAHSQLKTQLHEARMALNRREQAAKTSEQYEAGSGAKKSLVRAGTLIAQLDDGLRRLGDAGDSNGRAERKGDADTWTGDRLGAGEIRRRRDMLSAARSERQALEGVLNTLAVKSTLANAAQTSLDMKQAGNGVGAAKAGLVGNGAPARGGRVLGGPPAPETARTRELDNEGVLQLQAQMMKEQDMDVDELAKVVRRMRDMGVMINEELEEQSTMLDMLDNDVDRVQSKVDVAKKRIKKIS